MADVMFSAAHPTARKEHRCCQCGRAIEKGESYRRQGGINDGRAWTVICCAHCEAFARELSRLGFEDDEGNWPWLPDLDSGEVAYVGLSQQHGMFRARWRTPEGGLYTYPKGDDRG